MRCGRLWLKCLIEEPRVETLGSLFSASSPGGRLDRLPGVHTNLYLAVISLTLCLIPIESTSSATSTGIIVRWVG